MQFRAMAMNRLDNLKPPSGSPYKRKLLLIDGRCKAGISHEQKENKSQTRNYPK